MDTMCSLVTYFSAGNRCSIVAEQGSHVQNRCHATSCTVVCIAGICIAILGVCVCVVLSTYIHHTL